MSIEQDSIGPKIVICHISLSTNVEYMIPNEHPKSHMSYYEAFMTWDGKNKQYTNKILESQGWFRCSERV